MAIMVVLEDDVAATFKELTRAGQREAVMVGSFLSSLAAIERFGARYFEDMLEDGDAVAIGSTTESCSYCLRVPNTSFSIVLVYFPQRQVVSACKWCDSVPRCDGPSCRMVLEEEQM